MALPELPEPAVPENSCPPDLPREPLPPLLLFEELPVVSLPANSMSVLSISPYCWLLVQSLNCSLRLLICSLIWFLRDHRKTPAPTAAAAAPAAGRRAGAAAGYAGVAGVGELELGVVGAAILLAARPVAELIAEIADLIADLVTARPQENARANRCGGCSGGGDRPFLGRASPAAKLVTAFRIVVLATALVVPRHVIFSFAFNGCPTRL